MTAFAIIIYILFGMYVFYFLSGFINGFTGRWTIKARFWAEIIIGVILLFSVIGLSGVLKSTSSSTTVATQVSTTTENANTPETSTVLGNTIAPTYNGSDLVNLRLECAGQAQTGFARFVQNQNQIDSQAGINDGDRYTLSQYHFNQKLAACLIVVDDSFNSPNMGPSDTTYLVNLDENKQIMYCTTYGEPVTSSLCYDDNTNGQAVGNIVSRDDWLSILNQYMNQ